MPKSSKKLSLGTAAPAPTILPDQSGTIGPAAPALHVSQDDTTVHGVTVSAIPGGKWATNTAAKIADDDDFGEDMTKAITAGETFKRKVFTVLFRLREIFTAEERAAFPHLLPKLKDQTPAQSNMFIAEYKKPSKNKEGKDTSTTGNRYDDLAYNLPWIKAWAEHKDYLVAAKKDPTKRKAEHAKWSSYRFDTEIAMFGKRVKDGITMIKDAVKVEFLAAEINTFPQVGCELITYQDKDGETVLIDNPDALAIWSKVERDPITKLELSTSMSSSSFLALKPSKVADEKGGKANVTYTDMLASAGRVTGSGDATGTTEPPVRNLDNLEGYLAEIARFLSQEHNANALRSKLAGKDKKGNPLLSDDYIVTIQRALQELEAIATHPEFAARVKPAMAAAAAREMQRRGIAVQSVTVAA